MPHLCPTSWTAAFLSFWLIFLSMNTLIWWIQLPKFPQIAFPKASVNSTLWQWN